MNTKKAKDILVDAKKDHIYAVSELEAFERNVRKHAYFNLISQSNAQKFNLEFEHSIAVDDENWKHWQKLKNDVTNTSLELFEAELIWEIAITELRNDNVE